MANATQVLEQSVVVFSQNYLPLCRVNIKRAMSTTGYAYTLLVTNKAEALGFSIEGAWRVRLSSLIVNIPKHIRLKITSNEKTWKFPLINRREVLRQEHRSFQYCDRGKRLTLDHVIPSSKSYSHTWDNVVAACERCNFRKGHTPIETGIQWRTKLKTPVHTAIAFAGKFWIDVQANLE